MPSLVYGEYIEDVNKAHKHDESTLPRTTIEITDPGHTHQLTIKLGTWNTWVISDVSGKSTVQATGDWPLSQLSEVISAKPNKTSISGSIPRTSLEITLDGENHLRPLQIRVYYWIQVFTSYITQDPSGKLAVVISGQSCNNTNTDINISELSTTLMQLISTKIVDYLLPQIQTNATNIDELTLTTTLLSDNIGAHNTLIETIKTQIADIITTILMLNTQYMLLTGQLNNKLNALTINIAEPLDLFINIALTSQDEKTGNVVNSTLDISLNTNIPTGIVKIIDDKTYLMFDTKTCSAAVSLTSQYTETGE